MEQKDVWAILTALRGPDNVNHELKEYTTAVIRNHVLADLAMTVGAVVWGDTPEYAEKRRTWLSFSSPLLGHFEAHAAAAFRALERRDVEATEIVKPLDAPVTSV